jgi:hypothetical protein
MKASKFISKVKNVKRKPLRDDASLAEQIDRQIDNEEEMQAIAEQCDRDMYGDDYDTLKWSGWLER